MSSHFPMEERRKSFNEDSQRFEKNIYNVTTYSLKNNTSNRQPLKTDVLNGFQPTTVAFREIIKPAYMLLRQISANFNSSYSNFNKPFYLSLKSCSKPVISSVWLTLCKQATARFCGSNRSAAFRHKSTMPSKQCAEISIFMLCF